MTADSSPRPTLRSVLERLGCRSMLERLEGPIEAAGFWLAVALPVSYLPLLARGIDTRAGLGLFLGLVALHVCSLVVGRDHRQ